MPRANRYYFRSRVEHITHRCHKKEFLPKFAEDRQVWLDWLFEAGKRFGIVILNCTAASNHIHVLVYDRQRGEVRFPVDDFADCVFGDVAKAVTGPFFSLPFSTGRQSFCGILFAVGAISLRLFAFYNEYIRNRWSSVFFESLRV